MTRPPKSKRPSLAAYILERDPVARAAYRRALQADERYRPFAGYGMSEYATAGWAHRLHVDPGEPPVVWWSAPPWSLPPPARPQPQRVGRCADAGDDVTEADDLSRIRHALCIALDVNPALSEPTYDLLLRLLTRRWTPADEDWKARAERLADDVQRLMQEANAMEPRMIELTMQNRRMVALLRLVEWASGDGSPVCPWCEMTQSHGHLPTCPVAPILYPKEKA